MQIRGTVTLSGPMVGSPCPERDAASVDAARDRLRHVTNLPSPPAVAARLIEIADDPDLNMTMVVECLRTDPALTAKLLRLANSPLYSTRRRIETLQQAVMMLGLDAVVTATLSLTLIVDAEAMGRTSLSFRQHWARSVSAAVCAQAVAHRVPEVAQADVFLAALLQDLGVLIVARVEPHSYDGLGSASAHADIVEAEIRAFGVDHAEIGAELLASWNLPDRIVDAVRTSHHGDTAALPPLNVLVIAGALLADGFGGTPESMNAAAGLVERFGIDDTALAAVLDDIGKALPDLASLLNATVPPPERLAELAAELIMSRMMNAHAAGDRMRQELDRIAEESSSLNEENRIDPLTGLLSRRALDRALGGTAEQWDRFQWPAAILFLDLDHFKTINDTYGHRLGDEALALVAERVSRSVRDGDVVGRYGGDSSSSSSPPQPAPRPRSSRRASSRR